MPLKLKINPKKLDWQGLTYIDLHKNKLLKDRKIIFKSVIFALARQIPKIWANDYYFGMLKGKGNFLIPNNDRYIHAYLRGFIVEYYEEYYSQKYLGGREASINHEKYIKDASGDHIVIRTTIVGKNINPSYQGFVEWIVNSIKNGKEIRNIS